MHQLPHLLAGWAHATAVSFRPIRTKYILRVGQSQRQFPASRRPQKELGVRDMIFFHALDEPLLNGGLSYDIFELHGRFVSESKNTVFKHLFRLKRRFFKKFRLYAKYSKKRIIFAASIKKTHMDLQKFDELLRQAQEEGSIYIEQNVITGIEEMTFRV
jgi:hypothetical protein